MGQVIRLTGVAGNNDSRKLTMRNCKVAACCGRLRLSRLYFALGVTSLAVVCVTVSWIYDVYLAERRRGRFIRVGLHRSEDSPLKPVCDCELCCDLDQPRHVLRPFTSLRSDLALLLWSGR